MNAAWCKRVTEWGRVVDMTHIKHKNFVRKKATANRYYVTSYQNNITVKSTSVGCKKFMCFAHYRQCAPISSTNQAVVKGHFYRHSRDAVLAYYAGCSMHLASRFNPISSNPYLGVFMHDIIDTAVAAGSFTTLAAAVTAAGLVPTLKGAGPFTVFAPTDEAFAKLPAGTVEALLADIPKLTAILTYHVVAGKVMAADVMKMDGKEAATVNGAHIKISTTNGVKLNAASTVVKTDIECTNGVIHVIDTVIMPPSA